MNIYVASSWRNGKQPPVVQELRREGYEVYDFRHPSGGDNGFHWSEIDPDWQSWLPDGYREALTHPLAVNGFTKNFEAMKVADVCVLVLPCGRSAHLEAGWFVGAGKPLIILVANIEPELMYLMAHTVCVHFQEVVDTLAALNAKPGG